MSIKTKQIKFIREMIHTSLQHAKKISESVDMLLRLDVSDKNAWILAELISERCGMDTDELKSVCVSVNKHLS